ncbi:MAG: MBL fold metallo-hydrolase [Clostridia bacterium]|nr:MBL fold metallo-hydrolase [Clostridia bacterium]
MLTVDILFSGSGGNCTLIRSGASAILVDCGKSAKTICSSLLSVGCRIEDISAVFITHEHTDHISALDTMVSKYKIPVHITEKSATRAAKCRNISLAVTHPTYYSERVGDLLVESFPLPHDSADHVGYVITSDDGDTFCVATDIGHITEEVCAALKRCRRAMVESNHDVEMLKYGRYPYYLKLRILSPKGHLSNEDAASLICGAADSGCEAFALAHISAENNDPDLAYSEIRRALDSSGHPDSALVVADASYPVRVPEGLLSRTEAKSC